MKNKLEMEFNPGQKKFEPVLPLRKAGKRDKISLNLNEILKMILIITLSLSPFIIGTIWYLIKN